MTFRVLLSPQASKFLSQAEEKLRKRLKDKMRLLKDPSEIDCVKIRGRKNSFRTRVGDYRILFSTYSEEKLS